MASDNGIVVQTRGLRRTFNRRPALVDVNLELPGGAFHVLLGPNGAGKSTLIRIMMKQLVPSGGDCLVLGESVYRDRSGFGREVAYVSEDVTHTLPISVRAFAELNAGFFPRWSMPLFDELLSDFGIDPVKTYGALSRGQKMRFFFALAMARRPRLMLLDEVTATLDALGRSQVYARLEAYTRGGGTVVMATNIPADVQAVNGRIVYLDAGRVMVNTPYEAISRQLAKLRATPGVTDSLFVDPACVAVSRNSDGSMSHLIPRRLVPADFPHLDRRAVTVEELVVYLLRSPAGGIAGGGELS